MDIIGKKFTSNRTKEEIIVLEKDNNKGGHYLVKFTNKNEIRSLTKSLIVKGKFKSKSEIIGKRTTSTHGYTLEIIGYRCCTDIDVKIIETGEIRYNTYMSMFNKGTINPTHISTKYFKKDYINKTFKNSIGLEFIIIDWEKNSSITVEFVIDKFQKKVSIGEILSGHVRHDNYNPDLHKAKVKRLGQEKINKQGLRMKIVEYNNANDIIIEFEDGYKTKTTCFSFDTCVVSNPNYNKSNHKGKSRECEYFYFDYYNLGGKIIKYIDCDNIVFQWDDGCISNTRYSALKRNKVNHPHSMYKYNESFFVYLFFNEKEEIVYVGQTIDMWTRMRHHFLTTSNIGKFHPDYKEHISYVKYCECSSYDEMLSLEYNLIKELNPLYNNNCRKPKVPSFTKKRFKDCEWVLYNKFDDIKNKIKV